MMVHAYSPEKVEEIKEDFEDLIDTEMVVLVQDRPMRLTVLEVRPRGLAAWAKHRGILLPSGTDPEARLAIPYLWGWREEEEAADWLIPLEEYTTQQGVPYRFPRADFALDQPG